MNGKSRFKGLIWAASLIATNTLQAQVPVGAPQAFVSPVVTSAQPQAPTTAPETVAAPGAPAKAAIPASPYLFLTAPYFGISLGPRINGNELPALYNAIEGTLSLGVEAMLTTHLYLGGEVFLGNSLQLQNRKHCCNVNTQCICVQCPTVNSHWYCNHCADIKTNWTYGFDIIPGYLIKSFVLAYLRIGVSSTHFLGQSSSSTAWRAGLGIETNAFCKKWYIRGEYVYSSYNAMSHLIRVRSNQVNIGLVYKFL